MVHKAEQKALWTIYSLWAYSNEPYLINPSKDSWLRGRQIQASGSWLNHFFWANEFIKPLFRKQIQRKHRFF